MRYRSKTYVIFDGDNDMWEYAYMKGWKQSEHIEFDFHDAHDLRPLAGPASEATGRARLSDAIKPTTGPWVFGAHSPYFSAA